MPNKPPRNKQATRRTTPNLRETLSAASVLRRVAHNSGIALPQGAAGLDELLVRLRAVLPEELRSHIFQAHLRAGELVVFTESAAWAGRLRVAIAELRHGELPKTHLLAQHPKLTLRVMPGDGFRR
jgi:hypothetical protein